MDANLGEWHAQIDGTGHIAGKAPHWGLATDTKGFGPWLGANETPPSQRAKKVNTHALGVKKGPDPRLTGSTTGAKPAGAMA